MFTVYGIKLTFMTNDEMKKQMKMDKTPLQLVHKVVIAAVPLNNNIDNSANEQFCIFM